MTAARDAAASGAFWTCGAARVTHTFSRRAPSARKVCRRYASMPPLDILQALDKRPFEPFRIQVSDGSTYEVRHPELVMVGLGSLVIGVPAKGQPRLYERYETIALSHVVKLLPLEAASPTGGNGANVAK